MEAHASVDQDVPTSYNGFAFVIRGSVRVGADATLLNTGQVGWLDRPDADGTSVLRLIAGEEGARVVFYAGEPTGDRIVPHGPFIGDSKQDIVRLFTEYRAGKFERMSNLVRGTRTT